MDVLEHVCDVNRVDAAVDESQIDAARRALRREIAREEIRPRAARRGWIGIAAAAAVAATVVTVGVVAPQRVDPAAAAVLQRAADVVITAVGTSVSDGQYLRIRTDSDTLVTWDVDMGGVGRERFNNGNRGDAEAGVVVRDTRVLYVPYDRSSDWVWDQSGDDRVVASYGDRSDEAAAEWEAEARSSDGGSWPEIQVLPGGEIPAAGDDPNRYLLDSYHPYYDEMPRDPQALLEWFRSSSGDPDVSGDWVVQAMSDTLAANLMPADLRAGTLRALALVPGIRVASVDGDETVLEYRSGDWLSTRVETITLDTSAGMITSVAQTTLNSWTDSGVIPGSLPDSRTTVSVSVVDSAPAP